MSEKTNSVKKEVKNQQVTTNKVRRRASFTANEKTDWYKKAFSYMISGSCIVSANPDGSNKKYRNYEFLCVKNSRTHRAPLSVECITESGELEPVEFGEISLETIEDKENNIPAFSEVTYVHTTDKMFDNNKTPVGRISPMNKICKKVFSQITNGGFFQDRYTKLCPITSSFFIAQEVSSICADEKMANEHSNHILSVISDGKKLDDSDKQIVKRALERFGKTISYLTDFGFEGVSFLQKDFDRASKLIAPVAKKKTTKKAKTTG